MRQHTGNWCGKTVSGAEGVIRYGAERIRCIDTPGTYSIASAAAEEAAASDLIYEIPHNCVICVCDATCPARGLMLAQELTAAGAQTVLCLNLIDEAAKKHIQINTKQLEAMLHIPVVAVTAKRKASLLPLLETAAQYQTKILPQKTLPSRQNIAEKTRSITEQCVIMPKNAHRRDDRFDRILAGSRWKYPVMLLMLFAVFWITMVGANYPSQLLANAFSRLCAALMQIAEQQALPHWLSGALIDGMLRGTGWVISVMLRSFLSVIILMITAVYRKDCAGKSAQSLSFLSAQKSDRGICCGIRRCCCICGSRCIRRSCCISRSR